MKKLLLSLAAFAAFSVSAETVVLDMAKGSDIKGTFNEEKLKADGTLQNAPNYNPFESMVVEGYTLKGAKGTNENNEVAYYLTPSTNSKTLPTLRVYKNNNLTVTAPAGVGIAKLELALAKSVNGAFSSTDAYTVSGEKSAWTLTSAKVGNSITFTPAANIQITTITVTTGTIGEEPEQPEEPEIGAAIYSGLIANADDWTINNIEMPEELTYIWKWDSYGYMKASAYKGGAFTAKAQIISPVIDLNGYKNITVSFEHAAKFQTSLQDLCSFGVKVEGSDEITDLPIKVWPDNTTGKGWDFSTETDDINAYAGKKVQFVFTYGSSEDDGSDTWEIKNFYVKGDKESGVENVEIDANAPAEYFNLQGVRVENPANGLYIVRQGNKVTKQVIR